MLRGGALRAPELEVVLWAPRGSPGWGCFDLARCPGGEVEGSGAGGETGEEGPKVHPVEARGPKVARR